MTVSALIIARNEEKKIEKCIDSLSFADEIVVVLDRSMDKTKKIVKRLNASFFEGEWEFEGERRNFGISKCSKDWILEVDADEIISTKLAKEIKNNILKPECDYYYIKLTNFVCNRPIKNGWMACLAPDGKFSLFRKKSKKWENQRVHPNYKLVGRKGEQFENHIDHFMSDSISDLIMRFNRNTNLKAEDLNSETRIFRSYFSIRKVFSRFIKSFIKRKGYKEGLIGILICILNSIYPLVAAVKTEYLKKTS